MSLLAVLVHHCNGFKTGSKTILQPLKTTGWYIIPKLIDWGLITLSAQ